MKLKKIAIVGLAVLSIAAVSACGKKDESKSEEASSSTAVETTQAAERPSDYGSVKLGNYKGVEIPNIDQTVTDEEVESQINTELTYDPDIEEVTDRAVQDGDTVNIDYTGTKDGVAFDGGTATGQDLVIGSNSFIDGFESGLIGHNIGETVSLNLTFPEDYGNTELAGAAVVFEVKINSISVSKDAVLNDEWVNRHSGGTATTVDEYRASVRKNLEEQKQNAAKAQDQYNAIAAVIENSEFDMKQEAVDYEYQTMMAPIESMVTQYGMDLESYAQAYGMTLDQMKSDMTAQAENYVKQVIVTRAIFKNENMSLTDEDYQVVIDLNGGTMTKDDLVNQYGQETVDESATAYKVVNFILNNAVRNDVTIGVNGDPLSASEGETNVSDEAASESSEAQ